MNIFRATSIFLLLKTGVKKSYSYNSTNFKFDKIYLKELEANNRSFFAKVKITPGEKVFQVPSSEIISLKNEKVLSYCKEKKLNLENELECLLSYLLAEFHSKNSRLKYYFETLPKEYNTYPQYYKSSERGQLTNSFFLRELCKIEDEVLYLSKMLGKYSYETVRRMYIVIMSRSFGIDLEDRNYYALVPFGDMFNTSIGEKNIHWYFDKQNNLTFEANKLINADEEIVINYNEGFNTYFLLYYGFTVADNYNIADIEDFRINVADKQIKIKLPAKPSIYRYKLNEIRQLLDHKVNDIECLTLVKKSISEHLNQYPTTLEVSYI
jgi:hypothetical protein